MTAYIVLFQSLYDMSGHILIVINFSSGGNVT